jgi:hypothetical protein
MLPRQVNTALCGVTCTLQVLGGFCLRDVEPQLLEALAPEVRQEPATKDEVVGTSAALPWRCSAGQVLVRCWSGGHSEATAVLARCWLCARWVLVKCSTCEVRAACGARS